MNRLPRSLTRSLPVAALLLGLVACEQQGPEPTQAPPAPQGREETRGIRNTESIGYAGDAIADKVDGALDASDARKAQLDRSIE